MARRALSRAAMWSAADKLVRKIRRRPRPSGQCHNHSALPSHEKRRRALKQLRQNNWPVQHGIEQPLVSSQLLNQK